MKDYYSDSEIRRNRRNIDRWSKRLLGSAFACLSMFVCTDESSEIPWWILTVGAILAIAGFAGLTLLDMTSTPRCYEYR